MFGRRKKDKRKPTLVEKQRQTAQPQKVFRVTVDLYIYAEDASEARTRTQQVCEHWCVDRAWVALPNEITEAEPKMPRGLT